MKLLLLALPILVLPLTARAACPTGTLPSGVAERECKTLHQIGAEPATETNPQDQAMLAMRPSSPASVPKLVVILHGHPGPEPTDFTEFQAVAASEQRAEPLHEGDGAAVRVMEVERAGATALPGHQLAHEDAEDLGQEGGVTGQREADASRQ